MTARAEEEAYKLWKSGKAVNCAFPDELLCSRCRKNNKFSDCKDLRLYEANTKQKTIKMSVICSGEECGHRIHFTTSYFKKRKKHKVR